MNPGHTMHADSDPFYLQRFVDAQRDVYDRVRAELQRGEKQSHWIWFIFPQLRSLGRSATAKFYGISSIDEAAAYLAHPLLGERLRECTRFVLAIRGRTAHQIFSSPDDMKFRSSMSLFAQATRTDGVFAEALGMYFGGEPDPLTIDLIGR